MTFKNNFGNMSERDVAFTINGGEVGEYIRNHDWSKSPLGFPNTWPQSLKTALSICLGSKFPMVIWWGKKYYNFYNDAYIPIAGRKHPHFIGEPAEEMWPEIWDVVGALADHVVSTGEATFSEDQPLFMERKGFPEELYFTFSFSPAHDESGAVGGMFCAVQEMTARVVAERRLRLLRELGDQVCKSEADVASCAAIIMQKTPNEVPFALFYLTDKDRKSATLLSSYGLKEGGKAMPAKLDLINFSKNSWPVEKVFKNKQNEKRDGLRKLYPNELPKIPYEEMPDSAFIMPVQVAGYDETAGILILGINPRQEFEESYEVFFEMLLKQISSQLTNVRTIQEQKQRLKALAEIDKAKTAFFSNVSHEFRTPLTLILGPVEDLLAEGKSKLSPEQYSEIELIHRNSLRLLKLVNALLDFSRIEAGRMQAKYSPVDLAILTSNVAGSFRSTIERAGLKFVVDFDPIPEPIYVDTDMWEKIILNLLSNAYKYTLSGKIHLHLAVKESSIELSVSDTGTGIPENEQPKVFQRFHRVEGAQGRTHEGTGIGLALVLELAKLHGGTTKVVSQSGVGSTFYVTIPRGKNHLPQQSVFEDLKNISTSQSDQSVIFKEEASHWNPDPDQQQSTITTQQSSDSFSGRNKIIVADDNSDMRDYVCSLLKDHYEVIPVINGEKALAAARSQLPDLIISDIMMPVMDGIQFLKALREDPTIKTIPVILLSARAGEEEKASGIEMGADDYLTKPFSAKELLARVRTHLHMAEVRQKASESESKLANLGTQRKWLESVLDLVPTPLMLMDPENGKIDFANQAAHTMAGGQFPMDIPLEDYDKVFHVTDEHGNILPVEMLPGARAAHGEKLLDYELVWHTPGGHFSLMVNSEVVPALEGEPSRVILCLRDVSPLKEIQAELTRSIGIRDQFLSVASHELNTPLTSLKLQTQMIQRGLDKGTAFSSEAITKHVLQNESQISRLAYLVKNMMDISRIETGKLTLQIVPFDITQTLRVVIDRLSSQIFASKCAIEFNSEHPILGMWDHSKIEQVLTNLLTNALKYGNAKLIKVSILEENQIVIIKVQDHGMGIAKEDQQRIFERFERAISFNEVSGLGLGLYIANQIAIAHGGSISVSSVINQGSTFTVSLPLNPIL